MGVRRGTQLTHLERRDGDPIARVWRVDVEDYGHAPTIVRVGDLDGSGEAPGVQLEFEHIGCPEGAAIALGGSEAELIARALTEAAAHIRPHQRLRIRHRRWRKETIVVQPAPAPKPLEEIMIQTEDEAAALLSVIGDLDRRDPRRKVLAPIVQQLELPF